MYNCLQKIKAYFSPKHRKLLASFAVFMMICMSAQAATYYWVGEDLGRWNVASHQDRFFEIIAGVEEIETAVLVHDFPESHADAGRIIILIVDPAAPGGSHARRIEADAGENGQRQPDVIGDLVRTQGGEIDIFEDMLAIAGFQVVCPVMREDLRCDGEARLDLFPDDFRIFADIPVRDLADRFVESAQSGRHGDDGEFAFDAAAAADRGEFGGERRRHQQFMKRFQIMEMKHVDGSAVINDQTYRNGVHGILAPVSI